MPIPIKSPGSSAIVRGGGDDFLFSNVSSFASPAPASAQSLYSGASSPALAQASNAYAAPAVHLTFDAHAFDFSHSDYFFS